MKSAAVIIQKNFRAYNGKRKYIQMKTGDNIKTDSYVHIFFLAIGLEKPRF
jgi:hypothetical protein